MSKFKLFCLPYAGGSAVIFNKWKQYLSTDIELVPIELAGRGKRIHESFYVDLPEVIEDVFGIISKMINGGSYALYGHSMGGLISYQLYIELRKRKCKLPEHVFFSGRGAPHIERPDEKKYHLLEESEFKKQVLELGGTPPAFFEYPELLEIFLPLLRNDFKLAETDTHHGEIHPLDCNISVFYGEDEDLTIEQCEGWNMHTNKMCNLYSFRGGHFFLHDEIEQIARIVNENLLTNLWCQQETQKIETHF